MIVDGYNSETGETWDSKGVIEDGYKCTDWAKEDLIKVREKAKEIAQSADLQGYQSENTKNWHEKSIKAVMKGYNPTYNELKKSTLDKLPDIIQDMQHEYHTTVPNKPYDADSFAFKVHQILQEIEDMLISKNEKYGDSALNPKRVFSKASPLEQLNTRIDDKLSRIANQNSDEDEDVDGDLIGYLVLRKIAKLK